MAAAIIKSDRRLATKLENSGKSRMIFFSFRLGRLHVYTFYTPSHTTSLFRVCRVYTLTSVGLGGEMRMSRMMNENEIGQKGAAHFCAPEASLEPALQERVSDALPTELSRPLIRSKIGGCVNFFGTNSLPFRFVLLLTHVLISASVTLSSQSSLHWHT